eukprot:6214036-Pleurochrysis_carterae.AAC.6
MLSTPNLSSCLAVSSSRAEYVRVRASSTLSELEPPCSRHVLRSPVASRPAVLLSCFAFLRLIAPITSLRSSAVSSFVAAGAYNRALSLDSDCERACGHLWTADDEERGLPLRCGGWTHAHADLPSLFESARLHLRRQTVLLFPICLECALASTHTQT